MVLQAPFEFYYSWLFNFQYVEKGNSRKSNHERNFSSQGDLADKISPMLQNMFRKNFGEKIFKINCLLPRRALLGAVYVSRHDDNLTTHFMNKAWYDRDSQKENLFIP